MPKLVGLRFMSCDDKISLIVTTYNWPEALELVLMSARQQTDKNFEVIIADDGSRSETSDLVKKHAENFPVPLKHFWHEDAGFQAAAARNGAVNIAGGGYLIFIDGDCCMRPDFIATHRKMAQKNWFVSGRRVYLKERFSTRILKRKWSVFSWPTSLLVLMGLTGQCNRPFQFLTINQSDEHRKKKADSWEQVQTCNLAVWKDDFYQLNGFDERYVGYGFEDSDFTLRLIRSGTRRICSNFASPVMHLYHPRIKPHVTYDLSKYHNPKYFNELLDSDRYVAVRGIMDKGKNT